jgi:hypothetical protein
MTGLRAWARVVLAGGAVLAALALPAFGQTPQQWYQLRQYQQWQYLQQQQQALMQQERARQELLLQQQQAQQRRGGPRSIEERNFDLAVVGATLGPEVGGFVRRYGDRGLLALKYAWSATGKGLLAMHRDGSLEKHPNIEQAFDLIAQGGDRQGHYIAAWVVDQYPLLCDPLAWRLFTRQPLEYVHGYADLVRDAKLARERGEGVAGAADAEAPAGLLGRLGSYRGELRHLLWLLLIIPAAVCIRWWRNRRPPPAAEPEGMPPEPHLPAPVHVGEGPQ